MKYFASIITWLVSLTATALVILPAKASAGSTPSVNILWGRFSRVHSLNLVTGELEKPIHESGSEGAIPASHVEITDLTQTGNYDPFLIRPRDFWVDHFLPNPGETPGLPPAINLRDTLWFARLANENKLPDVFVIAGHQVISEGWHNQAETMFLFLPTLLETVKNHPEAKRVFDNVKLAFLWGCNTMTDLEPHGPNGEYLSPDEIKKLYESGPAGKRAVLGDAGKVNTLEFYRARLAREYGPTSPEYAYTRGPEKEVCHGPGRYENCDVANLDRILPDSGLWDGSHRYNYPYMMKRLFPNAALVLGFSSASPAEEERVQILKAAFDQTYADLNAILQSSGKRINNILYPLVDPSAPVNLKEGIIVTLRKNWTIMTDKMNRERPSGSITPQFPELDKSGVLGAALTHGSLQYGSYEPR